MKYIFAPETVCTSIPNCNCDWMHRSFHNCLRIHGGCRWLWMSESKSFPILDLNYL